MKKLNNYFYKEQFTNKRLCFSIIDGKYYITDSYIAGIFNENDIYFNINRFKEIDSNIFKFDNLDFKEDKIVRIIVDNKVNVCELESGIFVKENFLNLFNYTRIDSSEKSIIKIYNGDEVIGYAMGIVKY